MDNYIGLSTQALLEHHGVKGMKWGVRKIYDNHKQNLLYQYKKKGYSGLLDINDRKFSGYNAKNPTIFFDHKHLKKVGSKKLTEAMIDDSNNKLEKIAKRVAISKKLGKGAALGLAAGTVANEATTTIARKRDEKKRKETRT